MTRGWISKSSGFLIVCSQYLVDAGFESSGHVLYLMSPHLCEEMEGYPDHTDPESYGQDCAKSPQYEEIAFELVHDLLQVFEGMSLDDERAIMPNLTFNDGPCQAHFEKLYLFAFIYPIVDRAPARISQASQPSSPGTS